MNYISKNRQSFGIFAKDYKKYRGSYNDTLFEKLFSLISKKKEETSILDLGCGVGNSTEPIIKTGQRLNIIVSVTGCDPDIHMLKQAQLSAKKSKFPITYAQGSAEKLPFKNEQFDCIISGAAFHWFANRKAMKEIQRTLKDKGIYFVFWTQNIKSNIPTIGHELYKEYGFKGIPQKLRDPKFVKSFFEKSGFSNVKIVKIPHVEVRTISESIGLLKTNSGYAVLSPKQRKKLVEKMTAEYKNILGKGKEVLKQEIYICYGYKTAI